MAKSSELSYSHAKSFFYFEYSRLPNRMYDCTVPICMWMMIDAYFSCCHCSRARSCSFERLRCQLAVFDAHTPSNMSQSARLLDELLVLLASGRRRRLRHIVDSTRHITYRSSLRLLYLPWSYHHFPVAALSKQFVLCSHLFV